MAEENFVDYVKIYLRSGKGGAGSMHFHRDRLNPKGGPDGGDGGHGGNIILTGDAQYWTLLHLKYRKHIIAGDAMGGGASRKSGADGKDVILPVPLGTVVIDDSSKSVLCEITEPDQEYIVLKGGRGGRGNFHFKSPTNQSPRYAQPGEDGSERTIIIELKVLADVGLVGMPNAGKSTLLSVLTAAKPKIGSYAFTTLKPNLGIVQYRDHRSFIMADIPGIIEGAHSGKGLGLRFLKHIERNAILLFVISADSDDIKLEYQTLIKELELFNPELLSKPRMLAISKYDLIDRDLEELLIAELPQNLPYVFFSAVLEYNLAELKDKIWQLLNS